LVQQIKRENPAGNSLWFWCDENGDNAN